MENAEKDFQEMGKPLILCTSQVSLLNPYNCSKGFLEAVMLLLSLKVPPFFNETLEHGPMSTKLADYIQSEADLFERYSQSYPCEAEFQYLG